MAYNRADDQKRASRAHYERNSALMKARAMAAKRRQVALNRRIVDEAKSVPCVDCGESYPPYVMDLDHVRGEKDRHVADMVMAGVSTRRLREEIAKCEVVCSNCHRERTHRRRDAPLTPDEVEEEVAQLVLDCDTLPAAEWSRGSSSGP